MLQVKKDYIWNTLGSISFAMAFPVLTIIITFLQGEELAGMFSVTFVTAQMFMVVGNYAVRVFQVTDISKFKFVDYQFHRFTSCALMFLFNLIYNVIKGYTGILLKISIIVCVYKLIDALADVYEGELQRKEMLYVAGRALFFRVVIAVFAFSIVLLHTENLLFSLNIMVIASLVVFLIMTYRPTLRISREEKRKLNFENMIQLYIQCFPLFLSFFLMGYITNSPKYALEKVMDYRYQTYYNAIYFPSQIIFMLTGFVFKPMLVTLGNYWNKNAKKELTALIGKVLLVVSVLTALGMGIVYLVGVPILEIVFGVNLYGYQLHAVCMIAAGGMIAIINFFYDILTIMRKQRKLMVIYLTSFGLSILLPTFFVTHWGIGGACVLYFLLVTCLAMLQGIVLIMELVKMKKSD